MALPRALEQSQHQIAGTLLACGVEHRVEGVEPLGRLLGVDVRQVRSEAVADDMHAAGLGAGCLGCAVGGLAGQGNSLRGSN